MAAWLCKLRIRIQVNWVGTESSWRWNWNLSKECTAKTLCVTANWAHSCEPFYYYFSLYARARARNSSNPLIGLHCMLTCKYTFAYSWLSFYLSMTRGHERRVIGNSSGREKENKENKSMLRFAKFLPLRDEVCAFIPSGNCLFAFFPEGDIVGTHYGNDFWLHFFPTNIS